MQQREDKLDNDDRRQSGMNSHYTVHAEYEIKEGAKYRSHVK